MAKMLVLYFDKDEDAEHFSMQQTVAYVIHGRTGPTLIGEYKVPTKWCECTLTDREQGREVRRGRKYGWHVHVGTTSKPGCGFARKREHPVKNLLLPDYSERMRRGEVSHWLMTSTGLTTLQEDK